MKGELKGESALWPSLWPLPQIIVSIRDKEGRNNAMVVGYAANVSHHPAMVMVGIEPSRFSHHMVKENGCFVVNLPLKSFRKEFGYIGSKSGRDDDKFATLDLKWEEGKRVNAPILTDCPVDIECNVLDSIMPGSNELFIGKVEAVHVNEEYLDRNGNILWSKMDLIKLGV